MCLIRGNTQYPWKQGLGNMASFVLITHNKLEFSSLCKLLGGALLLPFSLHSFLVAVLLRVGDSEPSPGVSETQSRWMDVFPLGKRFPESGLQWSSSISQLKEGLWRLQGLWEVWWSLECKPPAPPTSLPGASQCRRQALSSTLHSPSKYAQSIQGTRTLPLPSWTLQF